MSHIRESLSRCIERPVDAMLNTPSREKPDLDTDARIQAIRLLDVHRTSRRRNSEVLSMCNRCGLIREYQNPAAAAHQRQCVCGSTSWETIDLEQRKALEAL